MSRAGSGEYCSLDSFVDLVACVDRCLYRARCKVHSLPGECYKAVLWQRGCGKVGRLSALQRLP